MCLLPSGPTATIRISQMPFFSTWRAYERGMQNPFPRSPCSETPARHDGAAIIGLFALVKGKSFEEIALRTGRLKHCAPEWGRVVISPIRYGAPVVHFCSAEVSGSSLSATDCRVRMQSACRVTAGNTHYDLLPKPPPPLQWWALPRRRLLGHGLLQVRGRGVCSGRPVCPQFLQVLFSTEARRP